MQPTPSRLGTQQGSGHSLISWVIFWGHRTRLHLRARQSVHGVNGMRNLSQHQEFSVLKVLLCQFTGGSLLAK